VRVCVLPGGQAAAETLRALGTDVSCDPGTPAALTVAVGVGADTDGVDVVLPSAGAAGELHRTRLVPWERALASGRPDVAVAPRLLAHDAHWAAVAARRCRALLLALGALDPAGRLGLRRIDHVGSTAVPGLAAKPFLDLQVTFDRLPAAADLAAALAPLGWAPAAGARPDSPGVHRDVRHPDDRAPDAVYAKRLLVAPDPVRPAILHVRQTASPFARRVVRFRDLLRADAAIRVEYEAIKRAAADAHAGDADYDDYTRAKGGWLTGAYREVDARAGDDPWPRDPA
jgi:dephospho-CoA kinase